MRSQIVRFRCLPFLAAALLIGFFSSCPVRAEIWSDATGGFKIDAQYEGVDGTNLVLRRANGTTVSVPISRLSDESRALAKQLFEKAKVGGPMAPRTTAAASSPVAASNYQPPNRIGNVLAPAAPEIGVMDTFPSDPKLQQQFDYMKAQILAGHLEVVWYCLPDDLRSQLDSQEFRDLYRPIMKTYAAQNAPMEKMIVKLLEVLTTKKESVLGSSLLASLPPNALPMIQQGYDPGVGVIYEWMSLSKGIESIPDSTFTELVNYHLPRLGAHAKDLLPLAPAGAVDGFLGQIVVEQTSATSGMITTPKQGGGTETIELVLHAGRWLPSEFVEMWVSNKDGLLEKMKESSAAFESMMHPASQPESAAMMKTLTTPVNVALDSLLAATTQQEFDQAAMAMFQQAMMTFAAGMGGQNAVPQGPGEGF